MSKEWWACFIVDTVIPRKTSSGIRAVIKVVLPLPLQPARPKIRIVARPLWAQLGREYGGRNALPKPNALTCGSQAPPEGAPCGAARPEDSRIRSPRSG